MTIVSRYILQRVAEDYGVVVTFDPKPMVNIKHDHNQYYRVSGAFGH